jgi:hypothetical protein
VLVKALQLKQCNSLTATLTPLADVAPHVLLLGLRELTLRLQAYAPTWNENDPPKTLPPYAFVIARLFKVHAENREFFKVTLALCNTVSPTSATAA